MVRGIKYLAYGKKHTVKLKLDEEPEIQDSQNKEASYPMKTSVYDSVQKSDLNNTVNVLGFIP